MSSEISSDVILNYEAINRIAEDSLFKKMACTTTTTTKLATAEALIRLFQTF